MFQRIEVMEFESYAQIIHFKVSKLFFKKKLSLTFY